MRNKIDDSKRANIISLWNEGKSVCAICGALEVETPVIKRVLKAAMADGELVRTYETRKRNTLTRLQELIKEHPEGTWTLMQYAEALGVSEKTVASYLYSKTDKDGRLVIGWTKPSRNQLTPCEMDYIHSLMVSGLGAEAIYDIVHTKLLRSMGFTEVENLVLLYQRFEHLHKAA